MFVRTASERDLPAVSRLIGEVMHDTFDGLYGATMVESIVTALYSRQSLRQLMSLPRSEFLVADDGEAIAGAAFAAAEAEEGRVVDILGGFVIPSRQGHGIGGMLLDELEASFFESERVRVEIDSRNLRAVKFVMGEGFERKSERREERLGATLVTFDKPLV